MKHLTSRRRTAVSLGLVLAALLAPGVLFGEAQITIVNLNAPGVGFNDTTPAAPVGGNPGTTLGEQRLNVFRAAADIWGETLDSSVEIFVQAEFVPLAPNVLGSAGPISVSSDFPGAIFPTTWYHAALANKLARTELSPGVNHINARFSTLFAFYMGLDNNEPAGQVDLLVVILHELAHGLGFSNVVNELNGTNFLGQTDAYSHFTLDADSGLHWNVMTDAQRQASAINIYDVVWDGAAVTAQVPTVLDLGVPRLTVNSPAGIAGNYALGPASFGAPLGSPGVTGNVALADDGIAPGSDACTPLPAGSLTGLIALADRGVCGFVVKVKNLQDAGAIAAIIADNVAGAPPPGLGGADPTIVIPSGRVTLADGNLLKANLAGLNTTLGVDLSQLAGANEQGFAQLATFDPVLPGSSISHYEGLCFPNQLMEPAINGDLTSSVEPPEDMTLLLLRDVGWFPDGDLDGVPNDGSDRCPDSFLEPTVVIDGCDSGVPNPLSANGCTRTDDLMQCATQRTHLRFVLCVTAKLARLVIRHEITPQQAIEILKCAIQADIP